MPISSADLIRLWALRLNVTPEELAQIALHRILEAHPWETLSEATLASAHALLDASEGPWEIVEDDQILLTLVSLWKAWSYVDLLQKDGRTATLRRLQAPTPWDTWEAAIRKVEELGIKSDFRALFVNSRDLQDYKAATQWRGELVFCMDYQVTPHLDIQPGSYSLTVTL